MHRAASAAPTKPADREVAAGFAQPFGPSVCICVHLWFDHSSVRLFAAMVRNESGKNNRGIGCCRHPGRFSGMAARAIIGSYS